MKFVTVLALVLMGCGQATARSDAAIAPNPDALLIGDQWTELTYDGAQGTQRSVAVIQSRIDALSPQARTEVLAAAQGIILTCPYNRASVQLPLVLHQVAQRHEAQNVSPRGRLEWMRVQQGLAQHVALLESLEVASLPLPLAKSADHLGPYLSVLHTRAQLEQLPDPMAATTPLLHAIPDIVEQYDSDDHTVLDAWRQTLDDATAENWPMGRQLGAWRNHLKGLQGRVEDSALEADLEAMVALIDDWGSRGC